MEVLKCGRCGAPRDNLDNFCRRCGHQLTVDIEPGRASLPAVARSHLPARVQTIPRSLVSSVAVLAVGTGVEWLARRLGPRAARGAAHAAGRALIGGQNRLSARQNAGAANAAPDQVSVDEFIYVRKVELRR